MKDGLDDLDLELLTALQADGRQSNLSLAESVGTSNVTVANRLKRLTTSGLIRVLPIPDLARLGFQVNVLLLIEAEAREINQLAQRLALQPVVRSVRIVSGSFDIAIEASFRQHTEFADFARMVTQLRGVQQVQSSHVLEVRKCEAEWLPRPPVDHPANGLSGPDGNGIDWPTILWPGAQNPDRADPDQVRVAFEWHRSLLRGDLTRLRELSADDIEVVVEPPVQMAGRYQGIDSVLRHGKEVVRLFPLVDSTIMRVDQTVDGFVQFATNARALTVRGEMTNAEHLIRALIVDGRVQRFIVSGVRPRVTTPPA